MHITRTCHPVPNTHNNKHEKFARSKLTQDTLNEAYHHSRIYDDNFFFFRNGRSFNKIWVGELLEAWKVRKCVKTNDSYCNQLREKSLYKDQFLFIFYDNVSLLLQFPNFTLIIWWRWTRHKPRILPFSIVASLLPLVFSSAERIATNFRRMDEFALLEAKMFLPTQTTPLPPVSLRSTGFEPAMSGAPLMLPIQYHRSNDCVVLRFLYPFWFCFQFDTDPISRISYCEYFVFGWRFFIQCILDFKNYRFSFINWKQIFFFRDLKQP